MIRQILHEKGANQFMRKRKRLDNADFYGKDNEIVCIVSQNLGHERPAIVVHYLDKCNS